MLYQVTSAPEAVRPLVLVPGGLRGWITWSAHVERLKAQRTVVTIQPTAIELAAIGKQLPADYSLASEVGALKKALASSGLKGPLDLVGWSSGGATALGFALDYPSLVRSLILIEPAAFWVLKLKRFAHAALVAQIEKLVSDYAGEITEAGLIDFLVETGSFTRDTDFKRHADWPIMLAHRQSLRGRVALASHIDTEERLSKLATPVLLIQGIGSAPIYGEVISALSQALPHAKRLSMTGGHAPHLARIDEFLRVMSEFQLTLT